MLSDFQVDVNGEETFFVNMNLLASFSGKLRKMLSKSSSLKRGNLKLVFNDFPGGSEGFELVLRFCYNGGRINITPSNVLTLHSAAKFLGINENETNSYFESVHFWRWSELLDHLKHGQDLLPFMNPSSILQEILNAIVERISMPNFTSPFAFSSSDHSVTQFSGDISTNSSSFQTANWQQDLEFMSFDLFEKMLSTMIAKKIEHEVICSFILHYQRVKFFSLVSSDKKCRIIEVVITSLLCINGGFKIPFRSLCDVLQACSTLRMGRFWVKKVERMMGFRLDEATLDDLLVPCHGKKASAYDVDLILRLLKIFLGEQINVLFMKRLKKVGFLIDLYLNEVAPDPCLKPSKFLALSLCLPDSARESCDRVCYAMDMFFKVHKDMSEEEKIRMCSVLNYEKLSLESLMNLAENYTDFPACVADAALVVLQFKFKTVSKDKKTLEFRRNSSFSEGEDGHFLLQLSDGKECKKVKKNYANVARVSVTCPRSGKALPILCS